MKDEIIFSPFYSSFLRLCKAKDKTPSKAAEEAGISSGAPTAWKRGSVPKPPQRKKLCDYFGVTDNVLLGYEAASNLTGEEQKNTAHQTVSGHSAYDASVLSWFYSLPPEKRQAILSLGDAPKELLEGLDREQY